MEHIVSRHVYNAGYTIFSFHDNFYQQDKWEKYQELAVYTSANKLSALVYIGGNFSRLTGEQMDLLGCPAIFDNTVLLTGHPAFLYCFRSFYKELHADRETGC